MLEREVEPEHVHTVAEVPLTISPLVAVGRLKSISAKIIFALRPKLRLLYPKGNLWSKGTFVISVGNITLEKAKAYVRNQKAHHAKHLILGILALAAARVSPQAEGLSRGGGLVINQVFSSSHFHNGTNVILIPSICFSSSFSFVIIIPFFSPNSFAHPITPVSSLFSVSRFSSS